MRNITLLVIVAFVLIGPLPSRAQEDVLAGLRKDHPRLIVLDDDIALVKALIESDKTAAGYFEQVKASAEKIITEPVEQRVLIGPRLLQVSRRVLIRVTTLGTMYRLTGERRYFERARDEMLAAAAFEDWNPSHFLDTAEMSNALGIGYDWFFGELSPQERALIKTAIIEKGLKPGLRAYANPNSWHKRTNNWNQVCNGGLTVGALAIADEEPEIARQIITAARASFPRSMAQFTDGGCDEGPGYWDYATQYVFFYMAALRTAVGNDFGTGDSPGFAESGMFRIHAASPIRANFNFADAGATVGAAYQMFYFARIFDRPVYAAHERLVVLDRGRADAFHLLFFDPRGSLDDIVKLPMAALFKRLNVAMMRSAWNDPSAAFVGFKAGDNKANHSHADLGSFVYDVDGARWCVDLGGDDYNLPAYFGKLRWTYYRLRTESHNTLTIGNDNQDVKAEAPIVAFSSDPKQPFAVADLTAAYAPRAKRIQRGVKLIGRSLLVQDEMESNEPLDVRWNFLTEGNPQIDGTIATLARAGKEVTVKILEPADARFEIISANPPPPQRQQPNVANLTIRQPQPVKALRLVVLLTPKSDEPPKIDVEPLSKWISSAK